MARLPGIQFAQAPAPSRTLSPSVAVARAQQNRGIANALIDAAGQVAGDIGQRMGEDDAIDATTDYQKAVSNYQEFVAKHPTATTADLRNFALDSGADSSMFDFIDATDFDRRGEQDLPTHVWYAQGLEAVMEHSRQQGAEKIRMPEVRRQWVNAAKENGNEVIARASTQAIEMRSTYEYERTSAEVEFAIANGEIEVAKGLMEKSVWSRDPVGKKVMSQKIAVAEESSLIDTMLMTGDFDGVMDMMADFERDSPFTDSQRRQTYFAAQVQQGKVDAQLQQAEKQQQDYAYREALAALYDPDVPVGLSDILETRAMYAIEDFPKLINAARTLSSEAGKVDGLQAQATENQFITMLDMAQRGVFPDGVSNVEEMQSWMIENLNNNMTRFGADGQIIPGLSPGRLTPLLNRANELEDLPYEGRKYDEIVDDMKLRILRASDTGNGWIASQDSSQAMANALDDLHSYIDRETSAGKIPDLGKWKQETMPQYLTQAAQMDFLKIKDDGVKAMVVMKSGGTFGIDHQATVDAIQMAISEKLTNNPNADVSKLRGIARKYGEYWEKHGEYAGGSN